MANPVLVTSNPVLVNTPYGDVAANDVLAVEQFKAQQALAAQQAIAAAQVQAANDYNAQRQALTEQIARDSLAAEQARYEALQQAYAEQQAQQQAAAAASAQAQQPQPVDASQLGTRAWEDVKQANNYANLDYPSRYKLLLSHAEAMVANKQLKPEQLETYIKQLDAHEVTTKGLKEDSSGLGFGYIRDAVTQLAGGVNSLPTALQAAIGRGLTAFDATKSAGQKMLDDARNDEQANKMFVGEWTTGATHRDIARDAIAQKKANAEGFWSALGTGAWNTATAPLRSTAQSVGHLAPAAVLASTGAGLPAAAALLTAQGGGNTYLTTYTAAYDAAKQKGMAEETAKAFATAAAQDNDIAAGINGILSATDVFLPEGKAVKAILDSAAKKVATVAGKDVAEHTLNTTVADAIKEASKKTIALNIGKEFLKEGAQEGAQNVAEAYGQNTADILAGVANESQRYAGLGAAFGEGVGSGMANLGVMRHRTYARDLLGNPAGATTAKEASDAAATTDKAPTIDEQMNTIMNPAAASTVVNDGIGDTANFVREKGLVQALASAFAPKVEDGEKLSAYYTRVRNELDDAKAQVDSTATPTAVLDVQKKKVKELDGVIKKLEASVFSKLDKASADTNVPTVLNAMRLLATSGDSATADTYAAAHGITYPAKLIAEYAQQKYAAMTVAQRAEADNLAMLDIADKGIQYTPPVAPAKPVVETSTALSVVDKPASYSSEPLTADDVGKVTRVGIPAGDISSIVSKLRSEPQQVTDNELAVLSDAIAQHPNIAEYVQPMIVQSGLASRMRDVELVTQVSHTMNTNSIADNYNVPESPVQLTPQEALNTYVKIPKTASAVEQPSAERSAAATAANEFATRQPLDYLVGENPNPQVAEVLRRAVGPTGKIDRMALANIFNEFIGRFPSADRPAYRLLVSAMIENMPPSIRVTIEDGDFAGAYDPNITLIKINPKAVDPTAVLVHEVLHAATAHVIDMNTPAARSLQRLLNTQEVKDILKAIPSLQELTGKLYVKEAIQVIFDPRSGDIRAQLEGVQVPNMLSTDTLAEGTRALGKKKIANGAKAFFRRFYDLLLSALGVKPTDKTISAMSAMVGLTAIVSKTTPKVSSKITKELHASKAGKGGVDRYNGMRPGSENQYDAATWFNYDTSKWDATWLDGDGAWKEGEYESSEEAIADMAKDGIIITGRSQNAVRPGVKDSGQEVVDRMADKELVSKDLIGAITTKEGRQALGRIFVKSKLADAVASVVGYWVDDTAGMPAPLRRAVRNLRAVSVADILYGGVDGLSYGDLLQALSNRVRSSGVTTDDLGDFMHVNAMQGYHKALAAHSRGLADSTLDWYEDDFEAKSQGRGAAFTFVDKKTGQLVQPEYMKSSASGMSMEARVQEDLRVAELWKAQFTEAELRKMQEIVSPLYVANNKVMQAAYAVNMINDAQYEFFKDNPLYAPLKNKELHRLVSKEGIRGRTTKADNPMFMLAAQVQAMAMRVAQNQEKQLVVQAVWDGEASDMFDVVEEKLELNMSHIRWNSAQTNPDELMRVQMPDGRIVRLVPKSKAAAQYIKAQTQKPNGLHKFFAAVGVMTRWKALSLTLTVPGFIAAQAMWDTILVPVNAQAALGKDDTGKWRLDAGSYAGFQKNLFSYAAKYLPSIAMDELRDGFASRAATKLFKASGGNIGVLSHYGFDSSAKSLTADSMTMDKLQRDLMHGNVLTKASAIGAAAKKAGLKGKDLASALHSYSESLRFGMFAASIQQLTGTDITRLSEAEIVQFKRDHATELSIAAQASRDVLGDFTLRGSQRWAKNLYLFIHPALVSITQTAPAMVRSPVGLALSASLVVLSYALRQQMCSDGTDECMKKKNDTTLLNFGGDVGLAVAPELRIFTNLGRILADYSAGRITLEEAFFGDRYSKGNGLADVFVDAYSPLRFNADTLDAAGLAYAVTPTLFQPMLSVLTNETAFGTPVANNDKNIAHDFLRGTSADSAMAKSIAAKLYAATGVDVLPFSIDAVGSHIAGAHYRPLLSMVEGSKDPMDMYFGRFQTTTNPFADRNAIEHKIGKISDRIADDVASGKIPVTQRVDILNKETEKYRRLQQQSTKVKIEGKTLAELRTAKEVAKATNNDVEFQRLTELLDRTYAQLNKQMLDSLD